MTTDSDATATAAPEVEVDVSEAACPMTDDELVGIANGIERAVKVANWVSDEHLALMTLRALATRGFEMGVAAERRRFAAAMREQVSAARMQDEGDLRTMYRRIYAAADPNHVEETDDE